MNKKIIIIIFSLLQIFSFSIKASALELNEEAFDNIWVFRKGGGIKAFSGKYTNYTIGDKTAYCIEPGKHITTLEYNENGLEKSPYSEEINKKLELIGYYGYDYPGHNTLKYRMATQALIWETVSPQIVEFWTEKSGSGTFISVDKEKKEILKLVNNDITPSFSYNNINTTIYNEIQFKDNNNVLKDYEIIDNGDINARIEENYIYATPTKIGTTTITLKKKTYTNNSTVIFIGKDESSQKMAYFGINNNNITQLTITATGGKVYLTKLDNDALPNQGDSSLEGAIYGIYEKESNKRVGEIITDENGYGESDFLEFKTYYLKEEKACTGYNIDKSKHYFTLSNNVIHYNMRVIERVIKKKYKLFKVIDKDETGVMEAESNVEFEIYLKRNMKLIDKRITDKNGYFEITLPYGTYIIRQKTAKKGYEKAKDIEIVIDDSLNNELTSVVANKKLKSKVKIIKIDENSKNIIKRDNIKFRIKNLDNNQYLCQASNYPNGNNICEFSTKDGYFITPDELDMGHYQIEEIDNQDIFGYKINNNPIEFYIDENSNYTYDENGERILEIYFANEEITGILELEKYGEELKIDNNTIKYNETPLDNIEFEVYANDNIYSQDGTLIYKNDELVSSIKTRNGHAKLDNLHIGKYYLIEKNTSKNYILENKPIYFEIEYKNSNDKFIYKNINVKNYLKKGNFKLLKIDEESKLPLKNVKFRIYNDNKNIILERYTDDNGIINVTDLPIGTYRYQEIGTNENYQLDQNIYTFEIENDKQNIDVTLENKKVMKNIDVPITLDYEITKNNLIGIFISLFGTYLWKKRKYI